MKKLLQRSKPPSAETKRVQRSPDELEQERDLLERVAAGIALTEWARRRYAGAGRTILTPTNNR